MPKADKGSRNLLIWAGVQLYSFVGLLFTVVIGGVATSIYKRRFSWRAFVGALLLIWAQLSVLFIFTFSSDAPLRGGRELLLWGGAIAAMTVAGFFAGILGRRVGVWECYLASLITIALIWIHLAKGWHVLFDFGAADSESYLDYIASTPPGQRILGPMWDRVVALVAAGGFVMSIFGGSFAYLLFGDEGRLDLGFGFEWRIARKHLAGRHGIVSITAIVAVLGVALGVGALVAVTAVMSGYQEDVQAKILSTNAHLVVQKYGIDFTEYERVAADGLSVPGVLAASPFSFNEAMLSDGDLGMGVLLKGILPETAGAVTSIEDNLCRSISLDDLCSQRFGPEGSGGAMAEMLRPVDRVPSVIIGSELFRKLKLPIGGEITLTTPIGIAGARGNAPKRMEFRIGGAFRSGMHEFDSRLIYMHLSAAQELMGLGEAVSGVEFRIAEPQNVEIIAKQVLIAVGRYPYRTLDWRELNLGIFTALKLQKIVMFLVLCSIIIVGAFNIASTLFMAVVEKARQIGVLKSVGAHDASVMKIFVLQGWVVGLVGTVLGIVIGLLVCALLSNLDIGIAADVYMVGSLEVRVDPIEVLGTGLAALAISHLATLYPALKAARQAPVDAMRYE